MLARLCSQPAQQTFCCLLRVLLTPGPGVSNVAAADVLWFQTALERNAQKFNIAACAACAHKRATVSVAP